MAKSTLDGFLSEQIADHEWLDAKDKVNAPFSDRLPYQQLGELAFQYDMPETHSPAKVAMQVSKVASEVKRQIMLGKTLDHIKTAFIDQLSPELRVACKDELVKIAKEFPLLGNVYIDPSAFDKCETGSKVLANNQSRMAIFATKMTKCGGCSYNKGGFCRMYKKALVEQVPYDQKTFEHYQNHLAISQKIATDQKITSKEELVRAIMPRSASGNTVAKSVVYHDESKKAATPEKKYADVRSKEMTDIARDLSLKLASGTAPDVFKNYVNRTYATQYKKYPELFQKYAALVGSLGRVFVELDAFPSLIEARDFIHKHAAGVLFVLDSTNKYGKGASVVLGKAVISSLNKIPMEVWAKNLEGKNFSSEELKKNPIAVTKKAFLEVKREKAASAEDFMQVESARSSLKVEVGSEIKNVARVSYNSVQEKKVKMASIPGDKKPVQVKERNGKVTVMADKDLEIELEGINFDDVIKKSF